MLRPLHRVIASHGGFQQGCGVRATGSAAGRASGAASTAAVLALGGLGATFLAWQVWPPNRGTLAGSLPTSAETMGAILDLLQEATPLGSRGDDAPKLLFVDLGSGDGRVVTAVVQRFACCLGVGVDVLPESVAEARALAAAKLPPQGSKRASFLAADMGNLDLSEADIVFMFLPDTMTVQVVRDLLPFSGLRSGTLVLIEDAPEQLSHGFGLRHLRRGGVRPTSSQNPSLHLYEWRGGVAEDGRGTERPPTRSPFFTSSLGMKVSLRQAGHWPKEEE